MNKKNISILSILCLCFMAYNLVFAASDIKLPKISLSSNEKVVNVGDEITLNVTISDLSGGSIKNLELTYDFTQLSYIYGGTPIEEGKVSYDKSINKEETITFKFKVKEEAEGSINFKVSAKYYDEEGELSSTTPTYKYNTNLSVYEKSNNTNISYISVNNKSMYLTNGTYSILLSNNDKKANIIINSHSKANILLKKDNKIIEKANGQLITQVELLNINNNYTVEIVAENEDVKTYTLKINREPTATSRKYN